MTRTKELFADTQQSLYSGLTYEEKCIMDKMRIDSFELQDQPILPADLLVGDAVSIDDLDNLFTLDEGSDEDE